MSNATKPQVHQAESGLLSDQGKINTAVAGFTGTGHVTLGKKAGDYLELTNVMQKTGSREAKIDIRYASKGNRPCRLVVNGKVVKDITVDFKSSENWNVASVTTALKSGPNTVRIVTDADGEELHVDTITVTAVDKKIEKPGAPAAAPAPKAAAPVAEKPTTEQPK